MELQDFIENFAAQFDDTDASIFSAKTEFKILQEWSLIYIIPKLFIVYQL